MTLSDSIALLTSRGFQVIPQIPDFEREDPWACYMRRVGYTDTPTWDGAKSTHEYLLLIGYDLTYWQNLIPRTYSEMRADAPVRVIDPLLKYEWKVLEAVYERYLAPKNMRRPKSRAVYRKKGEQVDHYTDQQYKGFYPIYATILRGDEIIAL